MEFRIYCRIIAGLEKKKKLINEKDLTIEKIF